MDWISNTNDLELLGDGITLYPNPVSNIVTIAIDNPLPGDQIKSLIITDIKGTIIREIENVQSRTEIDVSAYPTGTYIITIITIDQ